MSGLDALAAAALSWAVTYAIHSSFLLGLAVLLTRWLLRGDVGRETLWRGALLGSVLTATLATALPLQPLAGRLQLPGDATAPAFLAPSPTAAADGRPTSSAVREAAPDGVEATTETDSPTTHGPATAGLGWTPILLLAWAAVAILLLGRVVHRNVRLFSELKARERLTGGPLVALLAELRRRAGIWRPVALSVSDACPTPLVIGASEICLPPRFLTDLEEGQQRVALAHELAHVRRKDPTWQLGGAVLNAVLFFQPLNLLARHRLREASEHLCDDWAVRLTGTPLALGQCLATVGSWTAARPLASLWETHAIAEGGSPLVHRIRRIAGGAPGAPELRLPALVAVGVLVLVTAVGAPAGPVPASSTPTRAASTLANVGLLERLAMEDASPRVRQEAAAGLSDFDHPAAAAALMRVVRRAGDPVVRAEAAQQLDEFPTDEVAAVLLEVVFEDPVEAVRFEAIDTLDDLTDTFTVASAREALARLAMEHPLPQVRLEAMSALSDDGR